MILKIFLSLPEAAKIIRQKVFIDEQGFTDEFDDKDEIAAHLVIFDEKNNPVATCRIFKGCNRDDYILGRIAVIKEYRGKKLGSLLLKEAEKYIKENGGKRIVLHAQQRITDFYTKAGFIELGNTDYDENCPHIWMEKYI